MTYAVALSDQASFILERIAWALDIPMHLALEIVLEKQPDLLESKIICSACRDKSRCGECLFKTPNQKEE